MNAKKIRTALFNPFTYVAGWTAFLSGLCAILIAGYIGSFSLTHFDGVLDTHSGVHAPLWIFLSEGLVGWLCISLFLLVFGKVVSKTPFRLVDLFGTQALARYPSVFIALATLPAGYLRFIHYLLRGATTPVDVGDALWFGAAVVVVLLSLVWMVTLMYKGYSVSCNIKGGKAAGTFIGGIIMAEIASKVVIVALMGLVTVSAQAAPADGKATRSVEQRETAAVHAAEKTLKLIDDGNYAESWGESAEFFKKAVNKEQWVAAMQKTRAPFGSLVSRELMGSKYMTQLPNAPKGEYVVIQFKTSFENKNDVVETFTPVLDQDGVWRMSGYYIR